MFFNRPVRLVANNPASLFIAQQLNYRSCQLARVARLNKNNVPAVF